MQNRELVGDVGAVKLGGRREGAPEALRLPSHRFSARMSRMGEPIGGMGETKMEGGCSSSMPHGCDRLVASFFADIVRES